MARLLDANLVFTGNEPTFKGVDVQWIKDNLNHVLSTALNWYSSNASQKESLAWLSKQFPDKKFSVGGTAGFLSRMVQRGFPLELVEIRLNELADKAVVAQKETKAAKEPKEPKKEPLGMLPNADKICEMVDYAIDDILLTGKTDCNPKITGLSKTEASQVVAFVSTFQQQLNDNFDKVGYENITSRKLAALNNMFSRVLQQIQVAAPTRKPRKKREVPIDKIVRDFKTSDFGEYKTVQPAKLVGAEMALVFNSKARRITLFVAEPGKTLTIKGASVIGFDETKSFSKGLRKPEQQLPEIVKAHKASVSKKLEGIRSVAGKPQARSSEHHVILKVW